MKKLLILLTIIAVCFTSYIIGYSIVDTTTNLGLSKPASEDLTVDWFSNMNDNMDLVDAIFDTVTLTEYAYLDGVTSAIQTQFSNKQPLDTALTNISALTYVSPSLIKLTADDTYAVRTLAEVKTDLAYQLSDISDVNTSTPTNRFALIADGTDFESRALVEADISDLGTTAALVADKLSVFAATTSAELAGVISDEIGTDKLVYNTSPTLVTPVIKHNVTAKTTTATLNIAESGLVTVTAAVGYTILLPTAVGNSGIIYRIKKTDDNANLITIDGDGTETIDGELTYTDLNYQYSYLIIISDNANWLIIGESTVRGGTF